MMLKVSPPLVVSDEHIDAFMAAVHDVVGPAFAGCILGRGTRPGARFRACTDTNPVAIFDKSVTISVSGHGDNSLERNALSERNRKLRQVI